MTQVRKWFVLSFLSAFLVVFLVQESLKWLPDGANLGTIPTSNNSTIPLTTTTRPTTAPTNPVSPKCLQHCIAYSTSHSSKQENDKEEDLTQSVNMLHRLETAWQDWIETRLKAIEYGPDYYHAIFEETLQQHDQKAAAHDTADAAGPTTTTTRNHVGNQHIFRDPMDLPLPRDDDVSLTNATTTPPSPSSSRPNGGWQRMIRKYQIKLLQIQIGMLLERHYDSPQDYCHEQCMLLGHDEPPSKTPGLYSQFYWVNGGHSGAAGYGNWFHESYTAQLERDLKPILQQIGLDWIVRNYAMKGAESGEVRIGW